MKDKKFYVKWKDIRCKDDIIVYAKNEDEAEELVDKNSNKIDDDYSYPSIVISNIPPRRVDKDNILIIKRNAVIQPKLKPIRSFYGDLMYNILEDKEEIALAYLNEKETNALKRKIKILIMKQISKSKKRIN